MKIAMVASEANPLCKSGGLADVVFSLSKELTIKGEEVIIILPFYKYIKEKKNPKVSRVAVFDVHMSWRKQGASIYRTYIDGITFLLVQNDFYFNRDNLYGYDDDGERFAFFTLAVKETFKVLNCSPDIIHIHDWQPGMLATLIKETENFNSLFKNTRFILTIHNPAFQGFIDKYYLNNFYGLSDELYESGKVRFDGKVSTLKSAIIYCDKITTVSPTHRDELLSVEGGKGLQDVIELRRDDFIGVLNGIDYTEWNPNQDKFILKNYNGVNIVKSKKINKDALLTRFALPLYDQPVFGFVSRLTWQKGLDIMLPAIRKMCQEGASVVILGSGEYGYEQELEKIRNEYPNNLGIYIGYNDELAHQIYAGSDFFLMPSLFEPCGIGQMIAERYGTLPIVRLTGGLKDSVISFDGKNENIATGLGFLDYNVPTMEYICYQALDLYKNKPLMLILSRNAMKLDHTWERSCKEYIKIYINK